MFDQGTQIVIGQLGENTKRIWTCNHASSNRFGHFFGKKQQLLFITVQFNRKFLNQLLRRAMSFFELVILDFGKVREAYANALSEHAQGELLLFS